MRNRKTLMAVALGVWLAVPAAALAQQRAVSTLDYYEIQNLYARFSHALDSGADNGQMFAEVFTPDGVFVDIGGQTVSGRERLAAFARAGRKGPTNVATFVTNVTVEAVPGGATGKGYLLIGRPADTATNTRAALVNGGPYFDELVKTAEGWRIKKRTVVHSGAPAPAVSAAMMQPAAAVAAAATRAAQLTADDFADIHHLYARYGYAFDGGVDEGRMWARMFTEDGFHVNHNANEYLLGHEALAEFARGAARFSNGFISLNKGLQGTTKDPSRIGHIIVNLMITPVADGVIVKAYRMTGGTTADGATLTPGGIYFDKLMKTPQGWRYKDKFYIGNGNPAPPLAQKYIDLKALAAPAVTTSSR